MTVINNSESDNWQEAVTEWEIYDCEEDDSCSEECICGKENIKYLYTIRNVYNGKGMANLRVPKIALEEQEEIIKILDKLWKAEDEMQIKAEQVIEQIDLMKKSIL